MIRSILNAEHTKWGEDCEAWSLLQSEGLGVKQEQMPPGSSEQLHYHVNSQQVFYILNGRATFEIMGTQEIVSANESIHIPNKTLHRIINKGEQDLSFLVISQPAVQSDRIEIITYSDALNEPIKQLNIEWLEKYFRVEPVDVVQLSNPKQEIIDKGGFIFYARQDNEITGTYSLLKINEHLFELGKMAVTEKAQGKGIGNMLMEHALITAREKGIEKLILYSNTKLDSAIHLYRKYGFTETTLDPGHYERANIKMEKVL